MGFALRLHCFCLALAVASAWRQPVSLLQHSFTHVRHVSRPHTENYWSSRGRDPSTDSFASYTAPHDFSAGPAWVWQNELMESVRHSPLIDADLNIYVCTTTRLRKFNSDGHLLWTWQASLSQQMVIAPALYNESVYVLPLEQSGLFTAVSIGMNSGTVNWEHAFDDAFHGLDSAAISVYDGIIFFGARTKNSSSPYSDTLIAASASDGSTLWSYVVGEVIWNFSPSTPGDGTLLFSGSCGAVFRISFEGKLIWKVGPSHPGTVCVPSGGALGPNGIFYAEYNEGDDTMSDTMAAYNVTDGSLVWKRSLPYRAAQYPAVGKLGPDGPLAVVAAVGDNPLPPMPRYAEQSILAALGGAQRNWVIAVDAGTGATLWVSEDRPFPSAVGAGETDEHNITDGLYCWPDAQGIPLISGDGTVYTSSSHHGDLRALRDSNNDGVISQDEVSTFRTHKCFLNSPSIAPGMLVAAPCWGPMYVFKS
mmetsp:Transcript_105674/g.235917  ORF Transcript_105674/g.235917 Transcript_105674/m.235917 type:complete len:478 (-) Transcript_105674:144-1577(-)